MTLVLFVAVVALAVWIRGSFQQLQAELRRLSDRIRILEQQNAPAASHPILPAPVPPAALPPLLTPQRAAMPPSAAPAAAAAPPAGTLRPTVAAVRTQTTSHAPTLEAEIGSRWMLAVGVVVLVLGVAFFVKYAFDNEWVTPIARIVAGTVAGVTAAVVGLALAGRGYAVYGQMVAAAGLAMAYVAAYAAAALYGVVGPAVGFLWMAGVSAATFAIADAQRSRPLTLAALVLGFMVPFLVGGESGRHIVFFVYDASLAAVTLALVRRHQWTFVGGVAFYLAWSSFVLWASMRYRAAWFIETELYLTVLLVILLAIARVCWRMDATRQPFARYEALFLLAGPVLYHLASVSVLFPHGVWLLVYLIAATAVALGAARGYPAIRLAVWFAVAIPLFNWLDGHTAAAWYVASLATITAVYAMHLAAQLRDAARSRDLPVTDVVLFHANGLGVFSGLYTVVAANAGSPTVLAALAAAWNAALAAAAFRTFPGLVPHALALAFAFAATTIALALAGPWITVGWAAEGAAVVWVGTLRRYRLLRYGGILLLIIATARLIVVHFPETTAAFRPILNPRALAGGFIVAMLYASAAVVRRYGDAASRRTVPAWIALAHALTVALMTADIVSYWVVREDTFSAGFARQLTISLAWTAYALALIVAGFARRSSTLRYIALGLFGLTVAKIFSRDLLELDGAYRVAGFVVLGIVLLVASFLYQWQERRSAPGT